MPCNIYVTLYLYALCLALFSCNINALRDLQQYVSITYLLFSSNINGLCHALLSPYSRCSLTMPRKPCVARCLTLLALLSLGHAGRPIAALVHTANPALILQHSVYNWTGH
jgi:hypothetical protein